MALAALDACIASLIAISLGMRFCFLLLSCAMVAGCAWIDLDEEPPQVPTPAVMSTASCTDLWKHYADEVRLINDDETNWQTHDDNALQHLAQFGSSCNIADTQGTTASDQRCRALWDIYVKEVGRMTKTDRTWREHDARQTEALNRIRTSCDKTACTYLPGIRCTVPTEPS